MNTDQPFRILLYVLDAQPAFRQPAAADAAARYPLGRCVGRNPIWYESRDCETQQVVAVYVETRFPQIIADYQARGIPVLTELDCLERPSSPAPEVPRASSTKPPMRRLRNEPELGDIGRAVSTGTGMWSKP